MFRLVLFFLCIPMLIAAQSNHAQLYQKAQMAFENGQYEQSQQLLEEAFAQYEQTAQFDSTYYQYLDLADDIVRAKHLCNESFNQNRLKYIQKQSNKERTLHVKSLLASFYLFSPNIDYAKKFIHETYDQVVEFFGEKSSEHTNILNILGSFYSDKGEYDKAEQLLLKLVKLREEIGEDKDKAFATALSNLGLIYLRTGQFEKALPLYEKAIRLIREKVGKKNMIYAQIASNLAGVHWQAGRYTEAATFIEEVTEINLHLYGKSHMNYLQSMANLGAILIKIKHYDKANSVLHQVYNILQKKEGATKTTFYSTVVNNLGVSYKYAKQYKKAQTFLEESISLAEEMTGKDNPEIQITQINLATVFGTMREYSKAEAILQKVIKERAIHYGTRSPQYAKVLDIYGTIKFDQNQIDSAFYYCLSAFQANTKSAVMTTTIDSLLQQINQLNYLSTPTAITTYNLLLDILEAKGKASDDYHTFFNAIDSNKQFLITLKQNQTFDQDKLTILSYVRLSTNNALRVAVATEDLSKQYSDKVFELIEANKAMLLSDALHRQDDEGMGELPTQITEKERNLKQQLANLKKQLIDAQPDSSSWQLKSQLTETTKQLTSLREEIRQQHPQYYASRFLSDQLPLQSIQQELPDKTALFQYFITDQVCYLLVVDAQQKRLYDIKVTKDSLDQLIQNYRLAITDYTAIRDQRAVNFKQFIAASTTLYQLLLAKALADFKQINHLIILPDQQLGHIPFEAFVMEEVEGDSYRDLPYLIQKYELSYNYSANILYNNMNQQSQHPTKGLLACSASYSPQKADKASLLRSPRLRNLRNVLEDLPAARKEVQSLEAAFKGDFCYDSTTTERFFKAHAPDYAVIHLAMHGLLDQQHPIRSALAFTENGDTIEDNFLQAYEISQLELNAQLVVLSACETGYGKFQQGEGVMSLARSFMYARVPALIVSLWQVNDQSTSMIMQSFYEELSRGKTKSAALQAAKLNYLAAVENDDACHPAFWAAFVQMGNNQAIQIQQKKSSFSFWIYVFIGGVLIILLFIVTRFFNKKKQPTNHA